MSITITMDAAGRLVLPKAVRERLHLRAGATLKAEILADKIELTPDADNGVKLIRKGKRLVISGMPKATGVVSAIKASREDRDAQLTRRTKRK